MLLVTPSVAADDSSILGIALPQSLDSNAELDSFTFSLTKGESIYARISEDDVNLQPMIRLQGPDGSILVEDDDYTYAEFSYEITQTGTYTVFSGDRGGTQTGKYGIFIQNLKNPKNAVNAAPGTTYNGSLDVASEFDTYVIHLNAGDSIFARMSEEDSVIQPMVKLLSYNGTLLTQDDDYTFASITYTASKSGNYIILAGDRHGTRTGKYGISIQKLNNPVLGASPKNDQTITASLVKTGEFDNYYFSSCKGQTITVRMSEIDVVLQPMIKLFSSNGTLLTQDDDYTTVEIFYAVTEDGEYTVLAGDRHGTRIGNYSIYFHGIEFLEIKSEPELPITEIVIITTAVVGTSIIGLIVGTSLGKYKFLSFLPLLGPLYLRTVREEVFDNEKRLNMYNHIAENQPVVYTDIRKSCNLSHGEINWHAQMMTQLDLIRVEKRGFNVFFKIYGKRLPPEKFVRLTDTQKTIFDMIKKKPGTTQAEIAEKIKLKQQNISYNLLKLKEKGKIRVAKEGKTKFYYPVEN